MKGAKKRTVSPFPLTITYKDAGGTLHTPHGGTKPPYEESYRQINACNRSHAGITCTLAKK